MTERRKLVRTLSAPPIRSQHGNGGRSASFSSGAMANNTNAMNKVQKRPKSSVQQGGLFSFGCETLEETMNKFQTTGRMNERLRARRRTESEINLYGRRSQALEAEMPRRVGGQELDLMLLRHTRPTASFSARVSSVSRFIPRDANTPSGGGQVVRNDYYVINPDRFKGVQPLTGKEMKQLINRLSSYNANTGPAESRRVMSPQMKAQVGPLGSYRWNGLRNC